MLESCGEIRELCSSWLVARCIHPAGSVQPGFYRYSVACTHLLASLLHCMHGHYSGTILDKMSIIMQPSSYYKDTSEPHSYMHMHSNTSSYAPLPTFKAHAIQ